jgi:hypothetical protein
MTLNIRVDQYQKTAYVQLAYSNFNGSMAKTIRAAMRRRAAKTEEATIVSSNYSKDKTAKIQMVPSYADRAVIDELKKIALASNSTFSALIISELEAMVREMKNN